MAKKSKKKYSQFRIKVLRILLFIGVVPLLIISIVSLATVIRTRLNNISELQSQVIDGVSEKIQGYLDQKVNVFNLVIDLNPDNISEIDRESLEFIAQGLKEAAGDVNEVIFADKYGKELIRESEIQGALKASLKDISEKEAFKVAISGENYFGPVSYTLTGPVMNIASQIENKDRQIIGVILAEISLEPVEREISQVKVGEEGFVYLVDGRGNLIVSSSKSFAKQGENLRYIPQVEDITKGGVHNGLSKEDRYQNLLGQKVILSGKPLEAVQWSVVTEWPWEDAFSVVIVMITRFLFVILATLILIVVFSLFFARLVVKPVEILSKGADEIAKGNLDHRIEIKTGDELEKLGERFNNMFKVLKENEELRDQFFFIATHELRAPVTVIKAYLSMILEGDFGKIDEKMKKAIETSYTLNERLVKLVQDLLEVARSEAGKMEIKMEPTLIGENVDEILKEFKGLAAKKGIKLLYEGPEKETKVKADPYRVKEVLTNLVDNAIKYTLEEKNIIVSHQIKENYLITNIRDQGIGILEQDVKKLFSKFFRVKSEKTEDIIGTGLGLFICKEIIERMGGKIWAESQLGKGSTFSFSLPLAEQK